jgi:hypothetical protein
VAPNGASVSSLQVDVSLDTPVGGPGVLDDVEILGVSDGQDGVVHLSVAILEDLLGFGVIVLPFGGIDGN